MHTPNFLSYPADSEFAVQSILQYVQYLQVYSREELISSVNLFRDYFKIYFVLNVIQFRDANGQFFRFAIIHYG